MSSQKSFEMYYNINGARDEYGVKFSEDPKILFEMLCLHKEIFILCSQIERELSTRGDFLLKQRYFVKKLSIKTIKEESLKINYEISLL
jgi:hypothetical protein